MKKGVVPRSDIDTDARWCEYSHTKEGWIFGYKLHLTCTTVIYELVVHLTTEDVTTATNVPDNRMYIPLTSSSVFYLPFVLYKISDHGYDAKKLYEYSKKVLGIDLVCPLLKDIKVILKRGLSLYALSISFRPGYL